MGYVISASTPKASVAVTRDDPGDALNKLVEFEDLGLCEIAVQNSDDGHAVTRDELQTLAGRRIDVAGAVSAPH